MIDHSVADVAIPACHNPRMVLAAIQRVVNEGGHRHSDTGGYHKQVWLLKNCVLKEASLSGAWAELYPQFYHQPLRQVIEPYRAWMVAGTHRWGGPCVWLLQRKLRVGKPTTDNGATLQYKEQLYFGMGLRDVCFDSYDGHRNAGTEYGCDSTGDAGLLGRQLKDNVLSFGGNPAGGACDMTFVLVTGRPICVVCVRCSRRETAGDGYRVFADTEGKPFVDYYCEPCKMQGEKPC